LEFDVDGRDQLEQVKSKLLQVVGEWLEPATREVVLGQLPRMPVIMNPDVRIPGDAPPERVRDLFNVQRHTIYCTVWPDTPRTLFDGKSAREAARDPQLRIRVMAAILNLELSTEDQDLKDPYDFNLLRQELGLTALGSCQLPDEDVFHLPLARWGRIDFKALSDKVLLNAFHLVTIKNLRSPMRRCAQELVARPSLEEKIDFAEVYRLLVIVSSDSDEALQHIDHGRRIALNKGRSPAPWYVLELRVRLSRREAEECNRLTRLLATRYGNDPGIQKALYQTLVDFGIISPEGQVRGHAAEVAEAAKEPAAAASAPAPGLWTSDSPPPPKESKLWLPGMP
jgi:hypothetical protein